MSGARDRQQQRAAKRATKPPSAKQLEVLAERAERAGCDRCRAGIGEMLPYFVCRLPGGGFSVRCSECVSAGGAKSVLIGACIGGPGDAWSRDDRAWFAAHPNRRWRLREPLPGELATAKTFCPPSVDLAAFFDDARRRSFRIAIATYQIAVGKRMRHVAAVPTTDPFDSYTDAGICRLIPGLTASMTITEDEAQRRYAAELETRLQALAPLIKTAVQS